jgi:hypothetical protein
MNAIGMLLVLALAPQVSQQLPVRPAKGGEPRPAFVLTRVIGTGEESPDGNGVFDAPLFPPAVDGHGRVALSARYENTAQGTADDEALLVIDGNGTEIRLREGDPVPDGNGVFGAAFGGQPAFYWPALAADGVVATHASILSPTFGDSGLMRTDGSTVTQLARVGQVLPGGHQIDVIQAGSIPLTNDGATAVLVGTTDLHSQTSGQGVWSFDGNAAVPYLRTGDPSPDGQGTVKKFHWGWIALAESGAASFVATIEDGAVDDGVLLLGTSETLKVVAREGELALPNLVYTAIDDYAGNVVPVLTPAGEVAARLLLNPSPPGSTLNSSGIFVGDTAPLGLVAQQQQMPGGTPIQSFLSPQVSAGGLTAVVATYSSSAGYVDDAALLLAGPARPLEQVARTGDALPHGGQLGHALGVPQISPGGTVALAASVAGSGFPFPNYSVLLWRAPGQPVREVLRTGDALDGRTVASIVLPAIHDPNGHRAINARGTVCFQVWFTDVTTAIYTAESR